MSRNEIARVEISQSGGVAACMRLLQSTNGPAVATPIFALMCNLAKHPRSRLLMIEGGIVPALVDALRRDLNAAPHVSMVAVATAALTHLATDNGIRDLIVDSGAVQLVVANLKRSLAIVKAAPDSLCLTNMDRLDRVALEDHTVCALRLCMMSAAALAELVRASPPNQRLVHSVGGMDGVLEWLDSDPLCTQLLAAHGTHQHHPSTIVIHVPLVPLAAALLPPKRLLRPLPDSRLALEKCLLCITLLAADDENARMILRSEGLKRALALMHCEHARLSEGASLLLRNLLRHDKARIQIRECDGITVVLARLGAELAEHRVASLECVRNLSRDAANQDEVRRLGGIGAVARLLRSGSDIEKELCAAVIWELSQNLENQDAFRQSGVIETLIELVRNGKASQRLNAAGALQNLAYNDTNARVICQLAGVHALVRLITDSDEEPSIIATAALSNLAGDDEESQSGIREAGALQPLVKLAMLGTPRQRMIAEDTLANLSLNFKNKMLIRQMRAVVRIQQGSSKSAVAAPVGRKSSTGPVPTSEGNGLVQELRDVFYRTDKQQTGTLGRDELKTALIELGKDEIEIACLISSLDSAEQSHAGSEAVSEHSAVSFDEFYRLLTSNVPSARPSPPPPPSKTTTQARKDAAPIRSKPVGEGLDRPSTAPTQGSGKAFDGAVKPLPGRVSRLPVRWVCNRPLFRTCQRH
jgi:hypothetical protein